MISFTKVVVILSIICVTTAREILSKDEVQAVVDKCINRHHISLKAFIEAHEHLEEADRNAVCAGACMLDLMNYFTPDRTVDMEKGEVAKTKEYRMKKSILMKVKMCGRVRGDDDCETYRLANICLQKIAQQLQESTNEDDNSV